MSHVSEKWHRSHLKAHADAALSTARLLPGVVAWQLVQEGLHCACICPMCGLGACGCVAYATETLIAAWRDAAPIESEPPGFVLQTPKPGSELAQAGVQGGELLLAVDGQQVRGFEEVQAAIRKHALGDVVSFLPRRATNIDSQESWAIKSPGLDDYGIPRALRGAMVC
jgi:membrane-associated protease RseP (regulator of RpoE activity)